MTDRTELRRLAEAMKSARAALVDHFCTYEEGFDWCQSHLHDDMIEAIDAFRAAASPEVVLGLLDEIDRLLSERDDALAEAAEQSRLLGMGAERELALMAERDQLRAVAVRLKGALLGMCNTRFRPIWSDDYQKVQSEAAAILNDPEVEKL